MAFKGTLEKGEGGYYKKQKRQLVNLVADLIVSSDPHIDDSLSV
jgi:hypothetical protein